VGRITMTTDESFQSLGTPVGTERVYGRDGTHGSCSSYASAMSSEEVQRLLEVDNGVPTSTSNGRPAWRTTHTGDGWESVDVIEVYGGADAPVPGFSSETVPSGTRSVIVVTSIQKPVSVPVGWLKRRWRGGH
jgi:hypothetical protein